MSLILNEWNCDLTGYSLNPPTTPNLFEILDLKEKMNHIRGDVTNINHLQNVFEEFKPEIVIHMAAQPIVLEGYRNPVNTYETNVMGTVNICECIRNSNSVKSFLNITTDKVYENKDLDHAFCENEKLNGYDPYSNSKSCSELVTSSYNNSFFKELGISCSTARAGNVIGGGDFADDRIIPDCVRACLNNTVLEIRNPYSIRPYQHVLEPLYLYLLIVMKQYNNQNYSGNYNIGPDMIDCINTGELVGLFNKYYRNLKWKNIKNNEKTPHEANFLKLNNNKVKQVFNYKPVWNIERAIKETVNWTKSFMSDEDMVQVTKNQINTFFNEQGGMK